MKLEKFQEQIFFATVRIVSINRKDSSNSSIGTGFLVRCNIDEKKKLGATYLISNKHVFSNPENSVSFDLHARIGNDKNHPDLKNMISYEIEKIGNNYIEHPDNNSDLACVNISIISSFEHLPFFKELSETSFAKFNVDEILPDSSVVFTGYPDNRYDTKNNLPIMRHGYIASIPTIDFEDENVFVIDAPVFPGSSGSPVFTLIDNQYKLLGVISQTMIKGEEVKTIDTKVTAYVNQTIGLGIVIKVDKLVELLEHAKRKLISRNPVNKLTNEEV